MSDICAMCKYRKEHPFWKEHYAKAQARAKKWKGMFYGKPDRPITIGDLVRAGITIEVQSKKGNR